jgi:hypothetical protein
MMPISFPDFFRFYFIVPWYSIFGNLSLYITYTRFNRTKYMSGNACHNDNIIMEITVFETMARSKYFRITPASQNCTCD